MRTITKKLARIKLVGKKIMGYRRRANHSNARIHHEKQVIFVHIPKTAGNSITTALKKINPEPRQKSPKIAKHAKAFEIKYLLGRQLWQKYFTFAFVRNPWDLMVSSFNWWQQKAQTLSGHKSTAEKISKLTFSEFMDSKYGKYMINERYGNFFDWIAEDGRIIVDYIGKVETIDEDWANICEQAGLQHIPMPHKNKSQRKKYQDYYTAQTREIVRARFAQSISEFNYSF